MQVIESYEVLSDIRENPMDLDMLKREMLRINGSLRAVLSNIDESRIPSSNYGQLRSKFSDYLDSYNFEDEIDVMAELYSEDMSRINNIRIKMVHSMNDRGMMDDTRDLVANDL